MLAIAGILLVQNAVPAVTAVATAELISASQGVSDASGPQTWLVAPLAFFVLTVLIGHALDAFLPPLTFLAKSRIDGAHRARVSRLMVSTPTIAALEDPHVQDLVRLSAAEPSNWTEETPGGGAVAQLTLIARYLGVAASAAVLATYAWWTVPVMVLPVLAGRAVRRRQLVRINKVWAAGLGEGRRAGYWQDVLTNAADSKEVRVFGYGEWALERRLGHLTAMLAPAWRLQLAAARAQWISFLLHAAPLIVVYVAVIAGTVGGDQTVGTAAAVMSAGYAVILSIGSVYEASDIEGSIPVLRAYRELRAIVGRAASTDAGTSEDGPVSSGDESGASPGSDRPGGQAPLIEFDGVSFRYPGSERFVLEGFDLRIRPGETLAIVGVNGAGKSTLAKLLAGLYEPTSGRITADGGPIDHDGIEAFRRQISVVFQDFVRYQLTARENVALGDGAVRRDDAAIDAAAAEAGLGDVVERLPAGWQTPLSRSRSDGVDLSGGQWQQVALARALYSVGVGAKILVLDEPTAHLDVRTEQGLFNRLMDAARHVTVVLISHRLATVRRADRIVVLDGGRVTESGSHDELMALGGTYAEMYTIQAERFVRGFDDRAEAGELV
ncbi:ABC transporter ATP-binding protein [Streptomyces capitiformicae]|nr:ATP-binding cassette domain-containing protein [Streptomyces capitiformicae]